MRVKIRNETIYRYGEAARSALQIIRQTPRSDGAQFVRRWRVEVDADCRLLREEDAFGNITHTAAVEGPISELAIRVEGEVETTEASGVLSETCERLPARFWCRPSSLTVATPEIRAFAQSLAQGEGGDLLATAHALNRAIHRDFEFVIGESDITTTADEVLRRRRGVCQDFAHLFVATMRALGAPARYVSGFYLRTDTEAQEASHAWAEACLPGLGWVSFDPANGSSAHEHHIRVAVGPDYRDAAPIRGTRVGGAHETMAVAIEVAAVPQRPSHRASQRQSQSLQ
jgi:transglutaminase-like putative cysteine protease